jgi:ACDE family multidrug resistance protein
MVVNKRIGNAQSIYLDTNLQIVFGVTLTAAIGIFSLSPAFPKIVKELQVSSTDVGLLITVFTLPGVLLMPIMGILADVFGRKKVLVPSLMLFAIAGGACFFIRDFKMLLVLRFFQGIGVAPLSSLNVTVIGDLYSGKRRTAAMGYNQAVFSIGAASFAAIGGGLAMIGWYYPFLLPLVAIPIGLVVTFSLRSRSSKLTSATEFMAYMGSVGSTIKEGKVIAIYAATIVIFIIVAGPYATYLPLLMGIRLDASPLVIGVVMSSMYMGSALSSSQLGRIVRAFSEKAVIRVGFVLYAFTLVIIPSIPATWLFFIPVFLLGTAQGVSLPIIQTLLGGLSSSENRAIIMSLYGTALRLGQTLGPVLMGSVLAASGISAVFYISACLALAALGLVSKRIS